MSARLVVLLTLLLAALLAPPVSAQEPVEAGYGVVGASLPEPLEGAAIADAPAQPEADPTSEPDDLRGLAAGLDEGRLSTAVEIAILLTVLTLLPAILITVTSFTRIVIVLSFVRRALATNELPPTQVILGATGGPNCDD